MAGTTMAELQELGAWKSALMVKRYAHFAHRFDAFETFVRGSARKLSLTPGTRDVI